MSNKTQLQTNNTTLDGYIARINAAKEVAASLPEASSGGASVETCTVSLNEYYSSGTVTYTDSNMTLQTASGEASIMVAKNTLLMATFLDGYYMTEYGEVTFVANGYTTNSNPIRIYTVTGDGSIICERADDPA